MIVLLVDDQYHPVQQLVKRLGQHSHVTGEGDVVFIHQLVVKFVLESSVGHQQGSYSKPLGHPPLSLFPENDQYLQY